MQKILGAAVVVMLSAVIANASTITGRLVGTQDATDQSVWHVAVQVSSGQTTSDNTDGGVSGVQFDIISAGHGKSSAAPQTASGPNFAKAKTTFNVTGFTNVTPAKRDAVPADNAGNALYDADGDLDAVFGSIFDTGNFANTTVGRNGLNPVFTTIATVDFTIPVGQTDKLNLVLVGPQYYDFTAPAPSFQRAYTTMAIDSSGTNGAIGVPEPTSLALLGLGSVGLIGFVRRRRA